MPGASSKGFTLNLDLAKSILDWSLKVVAAVAFVAQFFIQFYVQQDRVQDRAKRDDSEIQKLRTDLDLLQRELVLERIEKGALEQRVADQEKFYLLTKH
jgi:hypothetical protein